MYVDTNVYLDYLEDRSDRLRPLGELAAEFFQRTLGYEFEIVVSPHVLVGLSSYGLSDDAVEELFLWLKPKIVKMVTTSDDKKIARKLAHQKVIHFKDGFELNRDGIHKT